MKANYIGCEVSASMGHRCGYRKQKIIHKKEKGCVGYSTQPLLKIVNTSLLVLHFYGVAFFKRVRPNRLG